MRLDPITLMARTMVEPHTERMKRGWVGVGGAVVVLLMIGLAIRVYVADHGTTSPDPERSAALQAAHRVQAKVHGSGHLPTERR
jgi:hypothetical protein